MKLVISFGEGHISWGGIVVRLVERVVGFTERGIY